MMERDRTLLATMREVNQALGEVVVRMLPREQGAGLDPATLRAVGRGLVLLGQDMVRRAEELDAPVVDVLARAIEGTCDGG